jgi:hypothetical protein
MLFTNNHRWERVHSKNHDIEYGLHFKDKLVFSSISKSEIMRVAVEKDFVKDSFKSVDDFVTAPHLKDEVSIRMRALKPYWTVVGEDKKNNTQALTFTMSEQF